MTIFAIYFVDLPSVSLGYIRLWIISNCILLRTNESHSDWRSQSANEALAEPSVAMVPTKEDRVEAGPTKAFADILCGIATKNYISTNFLVQFGELYRRFLKFE